MLAAFLQVETAGERVEAEVSKSLEAALGVWQREDTLAALRPSMVYDPVNNAVWLKAVQRSQVRVGRRTPKSAHPTHGSGALEGCMPSLCTLHAQPWRAAQVHVL